MRDLQTILIGNSVIEPAIYKLLCFCRYPLPQIRPHGIRFDGSNSLLETQHFLLNGAGNGICLVHLTPTRLDNLRFVDHLLKTLCSLDIFCALVGTYPVYIASVPNSYYRTRPVVGASYNYKYLHCPR